MRPAVVVEGVSKRYRLGEGLVGHRNLREAITGALRRPAGGEVAEVWSLRDLSFEVAEGEAVGIIGRNGAGKSTLLKVLTRITEPTSGVSRTRGRVGALLEVGTGFHPELTGRENVYLNGAILGMRRSHIDRLFDDIVDFAGVHRFLDTPVKRYSSGMYLRLAFAVAAHLEPEGMVVDEVLAVGDAEFQRKCLGKMAEVGNEGRTVLFVSHDLEAVTRLCSRAIWLDGGQLKADGAARDVVAAYLAADVDRRAVRQFHDAGDAPVALRSVAMLDAAGSPGHLVDRDEPFTVEVRFDVRRPVPGLDCAVYLSTLRGVRVVDEAWSDAGEAVAGVGSYVARLQVPSLLNAGDYAVGVWFGTPYEHIRWVDDALVVRLDGATAGRRDRVLQAGLTLDVRPDGLVVEGRGA
jgi:ABC-2 type transport system ATP-binding protein/lipopolysaccharide transport system ATP-binding protein